MPVALSQLQVAALGRIAAADPDYAADDSPETVSIMESLLPHQLITLLNDGRPALTSTGRAQLAAA